MRARSAIASRTFSKLTTGFFATRSPPTAAPRSTVAGDGFFFVFERARDAVAAAVEAQRALAAESWPENAAVKVRMGIHTGEVSLSDTHRGVAVHRVARISAAAHGGQIVLSQSTQTMVEDVEVLVPDLSFADLGDHLIKDFDRPVRLYQLVAPGLDERFPPLQRRRAVEAARGRRQTT